jgi:hypothetical protein
VTTDFLAMGIIVAVALVRCCDADPSLRLEASISMPVVCACVLFEFASDLLAWAWFDHAVSTSFHDWASTSTAERCHNNRASTVGLAFGARSITLAPSAPL